jgi:hypothetical protein
VDNSLRRAASATTLLSALCGCFGLGGPTVEPAEHAVLFIGNSLTEANDLPGTVAAIAKSDGYSLDAVSDAIGGTALIDHVTFGDAEAFIKQHRWDYVVMQQGPTTYQICHDTLVLALQELDTPIRAAGAQPAVFMSWPAAADSAGGTFDIVRESFQTAAQAVDALFMPVGEAWRIAWASDPSLSLYGSDGFHPAPLGTFLAALVVYEQIAGRDARTLPPSVVVAGETLSVPESTVRLLQQAAHEANERFADGSVVGAPLRPSQGSMVC